MLTFLSALEREIDQTSETIRRIKQYPIKPNKHRFDVIQRKHFKYYRFNEKKGDAYNRKYIGKADSEAFQNLFEASYNATLLELETNNLKVLCKTRDQYTEPTVEAVKSKMSKCVSDIPVCGMFDKQLNELNKWAHEDYARNTHNYGDTEIYDEEGERMRSKSECLVSNIYINAGVPKRHDAVIDLDDMCGGRKMKSPDFLIRCLDGKYIIHEHAGLLTNENYFEDFVDKVRMYFYNGFILGDNLFYTFDDKDGGINTSLVKEIVEKIKWRMYQL